MHVYRWDLDKTYLETDIHSIRGLLRSALEPASSKRNVPGSAALLRSLNRADPNARVCILSGSPTQMRPVLEEKLALDGVRWDRLILKDNLGNIKKGRLRAVRGQMGYKLPWLLTERVGLGPAVQETLFGDDSEVDAAIYALYADAIGGRVDANEVSRVLQAAKAYPDAIERALAALARIGEADAVQDIFIRMERGVSIQIFALLGGRVTPIFSWFQAAVILWERGKIDADAVHHVALACSTNSLVWAGWLQDLVRRGRVHPDRVLQLINTSPGLSRNREILARSIAHLGSYRPIIADAPADYVGFLRAVHSK